MRHVLAGPFIGEFGWELFCWQGFLRKRRPDYDSMTVISRPGRGVLYEDFADEFIEADVPFDKINMWIGGYPVEPILSYYKQHGDFTDFIPYDSYKTRWWIEAGAQTMQKFISYGNDNSIKGVDILMHVRNAYHCRSAFRNWHQGSANNYVEWAIKQGYSIACVGKSKTACLIDGTYDYRDLDLREELNIFSSSRVIIGSQSGPHHLACLCRLPVIAWQAKPEHAERLSKYWNPFNVRTFTNAADIRYWKERIYWEPRLQWLQDCTVAILENIP